MNGTEDTRSYSAEQLASQGKAFWTMGQAQLAFPNVFRAITLDPGNYDFHFLVFCWIWQAPDSDVEQLANLWAESYLPGLGLEVCEESLIEAFGEHPDRYELFLALSSLEFRRGRPDRAEELFGFCLAPLDDQDQAPTVADVLGKYHSNSGGYDDAEHHADTIKRFLSFTERHLSGRSGLTIIDAACGTGGLAFGLRPHAARLIGVDLSPDMAERAKPHYDTMMVGDMSAAMSGLGHPADVITCSGATYYLRDLAPFLHGAAAAIKPGGMLLFSDFSAPAGSGTMITAGGTRRYCHSPDLVRDLARQAGWSEAGFDIGISYSLPCRFWCFTAP